MTTATINLDLACELTVAMIADEAVCIGDGHDDLDAFLRVRGWGELLSSLEMARRYGELPSSADIEQVAEIARELSRLLKGDSPKRVALAAKAQTFLRENVEIAS